MVDRKILEKNYKEYLEVAEYSFSKGKYNSAVTLYYKALVELCDIELLDKLNKLGANHTERFDMLQNVSPSLYSIASKLFRFYRDSYNKEISKPIAEIVKKEVKNAEHIVFSS